jgi:predicted N-acetyltransferase YhbS
MDNKTISIRKAAPADLSLLSGLIRESFRDVAKRFTLTPENCPKHPSNCTDEWIEKDCNRGVLYFIAEDDGKPVGCVALEKATPGLYYLERLSVIPGERQKGLGRALVDHIFTLARKSGAKQIGIGIITGDTGLKLWYEKIGFVEGETKEFPHLPFSVTFMKCEL